MNTVSVVVINYNAGDLLVVSVTAALAQAQQVVVVDNDSKDSSLELLESCCAGESRLKIVRNGKNLGFAAGCNIGMQHCTQHHILFLNPDCVLSPNGLQRMLETLDSDPRIGMVGGLLLDPDGTEQGGGRRAVPTPWRSFVRAFGLTKLSRFWPKLFNDFHLHEQPLPAGPIRVEAISGALMLVRKEAIKEVGLWDEGYFLHCEDLDLCMRFRKKGWDILFDPLAPAMHVHGTCSKSRPIFVELHKHKGMVRFYRKFFQHQYPGVLMWLVVVAVWVRFGFVAIIKTLKRDEELVTYAKENVPKGGAEEVVERGDRVACKKVLVTGANGFVGKELCAALLRKGVGVLGSIRSEHPDSLLNEADYISVRDISATTDWNNALKGVEVVIHLAARVHVMRDDAANRLEEFRIVNTAGTERLARSAAAMGVKRFVYVSTIKVNGEVTEGEVLFTEDDVPAPQDPYAVSKWEAEQVLHRVARETGLEIVIVRPPLVYGKGVKGNFELMMRVVAKGMPLPFASISNKRSLISVRNLADALIVCSTHPAAAGQTYLVSDGEDISTPDLLRSIAAAMGKNSRLFPFPPRGLLLMAKIAGKTAALERLTRSLRVSSDKIRRELDWTPPYTLQRGLQETASDPYSAQRSGLETEGKATVHSR